MEEQAFIEVTNEVQSTIFDNGTFRLVAVFCILYTVISLIRYVRDLLSQLFDLVGRIVGRFLGASKRFVFAALAVLTIFWIGFFMGSIYCGCNPLQTLFY